MRFISTIPMYLQCYNNSSFCGQTDISIPCTAYLPYILLKFSGYSANNGLISVTIVSADSTLADGLSTSLFVLGTEDAIAYCEEHCAEDGFDAIMEDEDGKLYITDGVMDDFINMNNTANIQEIKTK